MEKTVSTPHTERIDPLTTNMDGIIMPGVDKYRQYDRYLPPISLPDRKWPDRKISHAPAWCSVDLRDGNQALINPMGVERKLQMYDLLTQIGFRQIEIGFPAASEIEFQFCRTLLETNRIGHGIYPQVLTQSRELLIDRTFESLEGYPRAIVHLYNSTSELQRRVVFGMSVDEITEIALRGVRQIKQLAWDSSTDIVLEYSPESFTGTEMEVAIQICNAVIEEWNPTPHRKMILNLPATVELSTPNVYADQIEWFGRNLHKRDSVVLSVHTHNDRGTGVAATELAIMAGADRVEGTLFGNGERTGNVDLLTVALNLYTQGIQPELDLRDLPAIRAMAEKCTEMQIDPRHPYSGELVFTAFSGSHQDAIRKGLIALRREGLDDSAWEVPYVPIDPLDIGREFEGVIRINSQSGKGGVAFVLEHDFGCLPPKEMHPELGAMAQRISESVNGEVSTQQIWSAFSREYLESVAPFEFLAFQTISGERSENQRSYKLNLRVNGEERELSGVGNGPIDGCRSALLSGSCPTFRVKNFFEHARTGGSDAEAFAFIQVEDAQGRLRWGAGLDANSENASLKALLSAVNRLMN